MHTIRTVASASLAISNAAHSLITARLEVLAWCSLHRCLDSGWSFAFKASALCHLAEDDSASMMKFYLHGKDGTNSAGWSAAVHLLRLLWASDGQGLLRFTWHLNSVCQNIGRRRCWRCWLRGTVRAGSCTELEYFISRPDDSLPSGIE